MNNIFILLSAIVIGASLITAAFIGRYQIVSQGGADSDPFAWRLDRLTGEIESCGFSKIPVANFDQDSPNYKTTSGNRNTVSALPIAGNKNKASVNPFDQFDPDSPNYKPTPDDRNAVSAKLEPDTKNKPRVHIGCTKIFMEQ